MRPRADRSSQPAVLRWMQRTFDFFDTPLSEPAGRAPLPEASPAPGSLTASVPASLHTVERPAQPLPQALAPAQFRHPRANREVVLANARVAYEFRRGRRKTIGFAVGPEGLVVSAPRWVGMTEIDAAVREKAAWIVRKLGEVHERQQRLDAARVEWRDGTTLPFLGDTVIVVLDPRHAFTETGAVLHAATDTLPGVPGLTLHVGLSQSAKPQQIQDAVQAWLMRQARRVFIERLNHFAPQLGVQWRKLSLSSAGTRWGSASADGAIRLNWRLVHFRLPVIDYVVAHELSHLRVMDHSPRFWETVRSVVPDYATLRGHLNEAVLPRW